jgi:multicomponent Na+:H+ antiporter subunit B
MIRPFDSLMLRTLLSSLLAIMQLFGVYVLLHGHYSPGGGFVAGVMFASSMILPRLALGEREGRLAIRPRGALIMAIIGIMVFAGIGIIPMFMDAPMLDYAVLPIASDTAYRRYLGILLIEVGVTLAVAGAMLAIFYALSGPLGGEE